MNGMNALIAQGVKPTQFYDFGNAVENSLRRDLMRQKLQGGAEEQNMLRRAQQMEEEKLGMQREKLGLEKERFGLDKEKLELVKQDKKFTNENEAFEYMMNVAPMVSWENYPIWAERLMKRGLDPQVLPLPTFFEDLAKKNNVTPEQVFNIWKDNAMITGKQRFELMKEEAKKKGETETPTEFDKTIKSYNSLPPGDPNKQFYLARIKKMSESTGLQVRVNKDGTVEIVQGPMGAGGSDLTKSSQTEVEKKILTSGDALQRLLRIDEAFKPEYQELGTRWSAFKAKWKEKAGGELKPNEKQLLSEFSEYKRRAIHNLNLYIKDITGAQLTVQEAERLTKGMPNPGMGLFDGDSPTEFKSKLSGINLELRMAIARNVYIKKHGLKMEALSLGAMKHIVNDRAKEIEQELSKKGLTGDKLERQTLQMLGEEFGLVSK